MYHGYPSALANQSTGIQSVTSLPAAPSPSRVWVGCLIWELSSSRCSGLREFREVQGASCRVMGLMIGREFPLSIWYSWSGFDFNVSSGVSLLEFPEIDYDLIRNPWILYLVEFIDIGGI